MTTAADRLYLHRNSLLYRLARRYEKFRDMGRLGADFTDTELA